MNEATVKTILAQFQDPYHHKDWISSKALKTIAIKDLSLELHFELGYAMQDILPELKQALISFLQQHTSFQSFHISFGQNISAHRVQPGLKGLAGVKNIIAVASGKGGVGKSTVSANLALSLTLAGARVGLLDADIYGPSQPQIMGTYEAPKVEDKRVHPVFRHGLATMSIGYLVQEGLPMIWRGPMVSSALQQLLTDTLWGELDYLIVDLPPGTGDIQLTLCQKIPLAGAVVVTTPQDLSLVDARRAIAMFQKVKVPILGVIENMSMYHCPNCGHAEAIFGTGAGEFLAAENEVALLGALPLDPRIRADADVGMPTVIKMPEHELSQTYRKITRIMAAKLALEGQDFARKFPKIVIEAK